MLYSAVSILIAYIVEYEVLEKVLAKEAQFIEQAFHCHGKTGEPQVDYIQSNLSLFKGIASKNKSPSKD